ncbi:hypothetical protein BX600DRAFT_44035 [Xylariales sp. PMI_506]|nr:hypothetical protein BX600DRAFT_44035 [Xylariales sp. PMI_506]
MAPEAFDLTAHLSDDSDDIEPVHRTPRRHGQSQPQSHPGSRSRRLISPPALSASRQVTASAQVESAPMVAASPSRGNRGSAQKPPKGDERPAGSPGRLPGSAVKNSQSVTSPVQNTQHQHAVSRTPKNQTPKKVEWSSERIEQSLRKFSADIGIDGAKLSARLLNDSWQKTAAQPDRKVKNWFADMGRTPIEGGRGALKIKHKHMGPGRTGKQEKREHHHVIGIKTNNDPVPKYSFHHVEITKNILSPNTMLNFVPHLRDLADHEEPKYRRWLENLESMDKTSGFATLSRPEKVHKTCQKERATILLLYLDTWLNKLSIENCSKSTLIRFMASQTDAVTPQQKSTILNSYSNDAGSPRSARAVSMFTEAFDKVFNDADIWKEGAVTLRDVLLLDKSVDTIVDPKKWMKDTPSQVKPVEEDTTVESFLETYALLGCLTCGSHSCEHGEYGVDNERKRFSVEVVGGLESFLRKKAMLASKKGIEGLTGRKPTKPCSEECYLNGRPGTRARGWSETEILLLRSIVATLGCTNIPVQCATAVATGRPCWDVNRQLDKLDLPLPMASPQPVVKVKPVHWYDRNRKMLLGDWQDHTITHEHQRRDHFDPCNHDGPCNSSCPCVKAQVMCERFCRCTVETCPIKFNGCACHSQGKTCFSKQKERPCICVQLNRECDPALCGSCGAFERANPRNSDDDQLFTHGCQNCSLQRGKSKSLLLGKSMIENCGYGLFTAEDIAQDDFIIEYVGELISQDEGVRREARRGDVFDEESNSSYLFTLLEQEGIWVDAAIYGNLSRYINHQDEGDKRGLGCNITPKILYVGGEYRIKFYAMRDIKAGEELFFNYGENFPNLTKKLLDEQKEEEKTKKKRVRKAKAMVEDDELDMQPKNPRGAIKGKKRGRKPKKKAFAKVDSDPEDDDDMVLDAAEEDPFPDIKSKPRKRKRGNANIDSDTDGEAYQPGMGNADGRLGNQDTGSSRKLPAGRKRSGAASRSRMSGRTSLFDQALDGSEVDSDDRARSKTRGRRGRKALRLDEDGDVSMTNTRVQRSGGKARQSPTRSLGGSDQDHHSAPEDESPSRVRTRRQVTKEPESSPLSALGAEFDHMEFETSTFELNPDISTPASERRRGRKRKIVWGAGEEDEEDERLDGSDADDDVPNGIGSYRRTGVALDSDESSSAVADRSRVRRKPARYSD